MNKKPELQIKPLMIRGGLPQQDLHHESSYTNTTFTADAQSKKTERGYGRLYPHRPHHSEAVSFEIDAVNPRRHQEGLDLRMYNLPNTKIGVSRHAYKQAICRLIDMEYSYFHDFEDMRNQKIQKEEEILEKERQLLEKEKHLFAKEKELLAMKEMILQKNSCSTVMNIDGYEVQVNYRNLADSPYKDSFHEDTKAESMNKSIKKSIRSKLKKALSPYSRKRGMQSSKHVKASSRRHSKEIRPQNQDSKVTPFNYHEGQVKSHSTITTPRKSNTNEEAETPCSFRIKPEDPPLKQTIKSNQRHPNNNLEENKQSTPCRVSNISKETAYEKSINYLQPKGSYKTDKRYLKARQSKEESTKELGDRNKSQNGVPLSYDEYSPEPFDTLHQGSSYDKRENSGRKDLKNSSFHQDSPFTTGLLTTYDTRGEHVSEAKPRKQDQVNGKFRGQRQPLPTESSVKCSSDNEYECIEVSDLEDMGNSSVYEDPEIKTEYHADEEDKHDDKGFVEVWIRNQPADTPNTSNHMNTIKEVSEENLSEAMTTGPQRFMEYMTKYDEPKVSYEIIQILQKPYHNAGDSIKFLNRLNDEKRQSRAEKEKLYSNMSKISKGFYEFTEQFCGVKDIESSPAKTNPVAFITNSDYKVNC